jgi:hypothetical protein
MFDWVQLSKTREAVKDAKWAIYKGYTVAKEI